MSTDATAAGGSSRPEWAKLYGVDVIALPLSTFVALRFWWSYFGCHDITLMSVAVLCSGAEVARRLLAARRSGQRPFTFFADRRADLFAAIMLATGPWPIVPSLDRFLSLDLSTIPTGLWLFALSGMLVFAARRLMSVSAYHPRADGRTPIRHLTGVPNSHQASIFLIPAGEEPCI